MRRSGAVAVIAVMALGAATAAFAALDRVGSVVFTSVAPGQSEYRNFTGNEITLTARNSDLNCDSVTATFENGISRGIFAGQLARGRQVSVGLPDHAGRVLRMDFNCRPSGGLGGVVDIAAGTDPVFADKTAAQVAVNTPDRESWRTFLSHLF